MKQDDINEAEWRNPANWTWPGPFHASAYLTASR
jgi:hypothetical protein